MGGKALKHLGVERLSEPEYVERRVQFEHKIWEALSKVNWRGQFILPAYVPHKEDHGDLDVVYYEYQTNDKTFAEIVKETLGSKGSSKNGGCTSIEWAKFQVDLIKVKYEEFMFAAHYYAHGTHAALMGRLASYYGFKLGWDGLYLRLRTKNSKKDILLTQEWDKAMSVLGYETVLRPKYIFTKEEIFDHLTRSRYFCSNVFKSTKPDRNYGFQEEFYSYALNQPSKKEFSCRHGWYMLLEGFGILNTIHCWLYYKQMQCGELVRPIKRFWRKLWHVRLKPLTYKLLGYL